ncbi:hypothetical protein HHK36_010986 [Tetracentron sinense]|uniref:Uncharacterized protein n=1 Tax=Tetracentron sinense TaxID=13715 RepID=A0A834Z7A5_TETSI|nr:hypothetical protein HHK36_010986 [Tetracentron sinense]
MLLRSYIVNDHGNRTTPSYVAFTFTDTQRLIGDAAKDQVIRNPINTIFGRGKERGKNKEDEGRNQSLEGLDLNVTIARNMVTLRKECKILKDEHEKESERGKGKASDQANAASEESSDGNTFCNQTRSYGMMVDDRAGCGPRKSYYVKRENTRELAVLSFSKEGGWPLGLQPLNVRVGLVRNRDFSGSMSFNTLLTGSPSSSTDSSSDIDTESTGSFFHDKSITLGSLIGVSSIIELSGRSARGKRAEALRGKKSYRSKTWFFSLCSKASGDVQSVNNTPSLGHFLEVERRAANGNRSQNPIIYEPEELEQAQIVSEPNSLFVNGCVAPPQSSPWIDPDTGRRANGGLDHGNGNGVPVLLSCMCGQPTN